jgi:hypothetical protein
MKHLTIIAMVTLLMFSGVYRNAAAQETEPMAQDETVDTGNQMAASNQMNIDKIKYGQLEKKLDEYKKVQRKEIVGAFSLLIFGFATSYAGYHVLASEVDRKKEGGSNKNHKVLGYILMGTGATMCVSGALIYEKESRKIGHRPLNSRGEINDLRPKMEYSFQPEIMPTNPMKSSVHPNDLAYGIRTTVKF